VFAEVLKVIVHRGEEPRLYFWRTASGAEVDILVETAGRLVPVEAKLSSTPMPSAASGIERFRRDFGDRAGTGYVIHPGDVRLPLSPGARAIPFADI